MSEITDEVSSDRRDHRLHPCPRMKQVCDTLLCLEAQAGDVQRNAMHNVIIVRHGRR